MFQITFQGIELNVSSGQGSESRGFTKNLPSQALGTPFLPKQFWNKPTISC